MTESTFNLLYREFSQSRFTQETRIEEHWAVESCWVTAMDGYRDVVDTGYAGVTGVEIWLVKAGTDRQDRVMLWEYGFKR